MSSTWELKEKSTGELKVTVEGDAWKKAQKKAFKKLAKKVNLPGFRPGCAPESLLKKHISNEHILITAAEDLGNTALGEGIKEHDLWLIDRPSLDFDSIDEEKVVFKFGCVVRPEVTLGQYKGLDVKKEEVVVSDDDVEEKIEALQERFAELSVKEDGSVENGDTAVIDFEGFKDGVPFEGGKGDNYPLVIGSGSFIPGFEEQLLGMKSEETKDIDVTFPENYQVKDLAGQPVVFKVTVHDIKAKILPEVNDDLIKEAKIEGVETVDAYKEHARKEIEANKENIAEQKFENEILTAITDNAKVDLPDIMVENETDRMVNEFKGNLAQQGFSFEQYVEITGQSEEELRGKFREDAYNKVKVQLVLDAVAKEEKVEISDEDVNAELEKMAARYGMEIKEIKKYISADDVAYDLRMRKALDLIKESAGK